MKTLWAILAATVSVVLAGTASAAVYDDFETDAGDTSPDNNGIEGSLWQTIDDNWHRNNFGGNEARSQATGESAIGNLLSYGIAVSTGNWLTLEGNGFRGGGGNSAPVTYGAPLINVINIRQNTSTGTIIAQIVPDDDSRWTYQVDPRGATTLFVEAIDGSISGGFGWVGIDNVQDVAAPHTGQLIANGSFENGLTGWTVVSGVFSDAVRHSNGSNRGGYEGGSYAASLVDGESQVNVLRSSSLTVSYSQLSFASAGFTNNGNHYELLDSSFNVIAGSSLNPVHSDNWGILTYNLLSLGLNAGDTFYLQMVDSNNTGSFGWIALDDVRFAGTALPEPASLSLLPLAGLLLRRRR